MPVGAPWNVCAGAAAFRLLVALLRTLLRKTEEHGEVEIVRHSRGGQTVKACTNCIVITASTLFGDGE